jgi:membrane-associated phospholipid phosphatase
MALIAVAPRWRLVDRLLAGYGVVVASIAATRIHQRGMVPLLLAHLALPLLAWLVARAPESGSGRFLRTSYPLILLTALYSSIDALNGFGAATTHDPLLQRLEASLFGGQPSRDWWRSAPSDFWSSVLHAVYFSYYVIVPIPALYFLATRRMAVLEQYLNGVIATYLGCYLCYMLFPVAGPYYEFARPTGSFVANGPARLVYGTLARGSAFGAAFPSSHVAATVAATVGAWLGSRRLAMVLAVPTALLAVGVVYCQMHYVIDSAAGVVMGVAIPLLVMRRVA